MVTGAIVGHPLRCAAAAARAASARHRLGRRRRTYGLGLIFGTTVGYPQADRCLGTPASPTVGQR